MFWDNGRLVLQENPNLNEEETELFIRRQILHLIGKWSNIFPKLAELSSDIQKLPLEEIHQKHKRRLKAWKILSPIITPTLARFSRQIMSSGPAMLIAPSMETSDRPLLQGILATLMASGYSILEIDTNKPFEEEMQKLLQKLILAVNPEDLLKLTDSHQGIPAAILSKYTNTVSSGKIIPIIPQVEAEWIALTISEIHGYLPYPIAIFMQGSGSDGNWSRLSNALADLGIAHVKIDPFGTPVPPPSEEDLEYAASKLGANLPSDNNTIRWILSSQSVTGMLARLRNIASISSPQPQTLKLLADIFGDKTEAPADLILNLVPPDELFCAVEAGLIDLTEEKCMLSDRALLPEAGEFPAEIISKVPKTPEVVTFLQQRGVSPRTIFALSAIVLRTLKHKNINRAHSFAYQMEETFGDMLIEHPNIYAVVGEVMLLAGRKERAFEILSAAIMFSRTPLNRGIAVLNSLSYPPRLNGHEEYIEPSVKGDIQKLAEWFFKIPPTFPPPTIAITDDTRLFLNLLAQLLHLEAIGDIEGVAEISQEFMSHFHRSGHSYAWGIGALFRLKAGLALAEPPGQLRQLAIDAFESLNRYYAIESFLPLGDYLILSAELTDSADEYNTLADTLLSSISLDGVILYDYAYPYLATALGNIAMGELDIAKMLYQTAGEDGGKFIGLYSRALKWLVGTILGDSPEPPSPINHFAYTIYQIYSGKLKPPADIHKRPDLAWAYLLIPSLPKRKEAAELLAKNGYTKLAETLYRL